MDMKNLQTACRSISRRWILLSTSLLVLSFSAHLVNAQEPATCSYNTWTWNVPKKRSENHQRVVKPYSEITAVEKDEQTGCTVCEEDQAWIEIAGIEKFRVCKRYQAEVSQIIKTILKDGFPIYEVIGYRVGKSKGPVDEKGYRTQFSNHSFGTAIDLNRSRNGLYSNCFNFNAKCTLVLGGVWDPTRPGTITQDSIVVQQFKTMDWHWGGQIKGRQKDFMHFSPSGY